MNERRKQYYEEVKEKQRSNKLAARSNDQKRGGAAMALNSQNTPYKSSTSSDLNQDRLNVHPHLVYAENTFGSFDKLNAANSARILSSTPDYLQ